MLGAVLVLGGALEAGSLLFRPSTPLAVGPTVPTAAAEPISDATAEVASPTDARRYTVHWTRPPVPTPVEIQRPAPASARRWAHAFHFNAAIYEQARAGAEIVGYVRRNARVPVARYVASEGCEGGGWYEVFDRGFACTGDGFVVDEPRAQIADELQITGARLDRNLPYGYAKVTLGTRRWGSIPDSGREAASGATTSGVQFVAVDEVVDDGGRRFVRTLRGQYHRDQDVTWIEPPTMHGQPLGEGTKLPVAFVIDEDVPLLRERDGELERVGSAERFSRFHVARQTEIDGRRLVFSDSGVAAPAEHVRVARRVERPEEIPATAKWIHVDLDSQTLVAHEGATAKLATLVSTGTPGHEPPRGVFRVHKRFISRTMSGDDDEHGSYEVQQVPWTMYYWGSLAIHGAYWHDAFGRVRSHGCTNVPPADARWLFYWSGPPVPPGWHGTVGRLGADVYTT